MTTISPDFAATLRGILIKRIEEEQLELPALPQVAIQVRSMLQQSDFDLNKVAQMIDRDPVISIQVLKMANSAYNSRSSKISTVAHALRLLGARHVRQVLLTACSRQVFESRQQRINQHLAAMWEHARAVALLAQDIAGLANCADPESAYLSGLLHDIGQPVVGIYMLEVERSMMDRAMTAARSAQGATSKGAGPWADDAQWLEILREIHWPVGTAIAKKWNLPTEIQEAITNCRDYEVDNRQSVANAVRFANAIAKRLGIYAGEVDHDEVNATLMVGRSVLGLDEEIVERLATETERRREEGAL